MRRELSITITSERMVIQGRREDIDYVVNNWIDKDYITKISKIGNNRSICVEASSENLYNILVYLSCDCENVITII